MRFLTKKDDAVKRPVLAVVVFSVVMLSGCSGGAVGLKGSPVWNMTASPQDKRAFYEQVCVVEKGFRVGTPEMEICIRAEPTPDSLKINPNFMRSSSGDSSSAGVSRSEYEKDKRDADYQRQLECNRNGGIWNGFSCRQKLSR